MTTPSIWHTLTLGEVCSRVQTQPTGLTGTEATARLREYGPNELQTRARGNPWRLLLAQFQNVLLLILLVAVGLSAILGHTTEAIIIGVIVVFAAGLGFVQEYRAERAIEALRKLIAPNATVVRDGERRVIPARELVPGDLLVLRAGDRVPADARVIEAINLRIEEAALTGESVAVAKHGLPIPTADLPVGDRKNMVYAGTAATYGRGSGIVLATGMQTEFGRIAQLLDTIETGKTPLQSNLDRVGQSLARVAVVVVVIVVVLGLLRGEPLLEMLIRGIALAVAVVPEALPAVVTISLALGVQRMVKRQALIRRLPAVETLGSVSVICSDKTGTLTRDEMTVREIYVAGRRLHISGTGYTPEGTFAEQGVPIAPAGVLLDLLRAGVLASDATLTPPGVGESARAGVTSWGLNGDPTEGALVVAAAKAGLAKAALDAACPRVHEIPFTSETKRMTTVHAVGGSAVAYAKGAPEVILASCTQQQGAAGAQELDAAGRETILAVAREMAGAALRVLALAYKPEADPASAEHGLTFLGLVGMSDPPRDEVRAAIATCRQAGIRPVMITGDHPHTAQAVAQELGLLTTGRVVTGTELDAMSDADLAAAVDQIAVYARVSPAHKLRVVTALQQCGAVVAMTGDGVNDAPALKKADIGIAMGITGTDVSKEAAAMMLLDDNFASIVAAVEEGRGIFANIKKYLMYLLSSNLGEMGLMLGTALLGLPLPLSAVQILYVNLATDGLPALALAVDPPERDLMHQPPRPPRTGIFTRPVVGLMVLGGLWSTLVNIGVFAWAAQSGRTVAEAMSMTFVLLVLIEFCKAYSYRSDRYSLWHRPFANRWLNLAILWELLLLGAIVYVPFLNAALGTYPLPLADWAIVLGSALTVLPVLEGGKWLVRHGWFGPRDLDTPATGPHPIRPPHPVRPASRRGVS